MIVDGYVRMSVSLNVVDLETDSVEIDKYGRPIVIDPEQFFADWVDEWCKGNGELYGASDMYIELDVEEE